MKRLLDNKIVGELARIFPTVLFILSFVSNTKASDTYQIPDFAFPQTVKENSDSLLKMALKRNDPLLTLREAMNLCISGSMLNDNDNLAINLALMDSIASQLNGVYKSLAYLIQAQMVEQEYSSNHNIYDSRTLPMEEPFPEDPEAWSGEMFKSTILNLVNQATNDVSHFIPDKISSLSLLISGYEMAEKMGMTTPEFICLKAENLIKKFVTDNSMTVIPFYPEEEITTIEGECRLKAKALLDLVIRELWGKNSLIKGYAITEFASLLNDEESKQYLENSVSRMKDSEGEGIVLYELWSRFGRANSDLYLSITKWLESFPQGFMTPQLKYAESLMIQKKIEVELPRNVLSRKPIKGKVTSSNVNKGYLLVYKLSSTQYDKNDGLILKKFNGNIKPVQIINISTEGNLPFEYKKDIEIKGLTSGVYAVIPSTSTTLPRGWNKSTSNANYSTLRVSDIAILSSFDSNEKDSGKIYVVKGETQEPISGAVVTYYEADRKKAKGRLVTNKEGWVKIPSGYYRIVATYGTNVAKTESGFSYNPSNTNATRHVSILTDLAVYRPGDTVRFSIVGWEQQQLENKLIKGSEVEIILRDANYSQVGAAKLNLNNEGRGDGEIRIPEGRLLGNYLLMANYTDYPGIGVGSAQILVEEYKTPGFLVTLKQQDNFKNDMVSFQGEALTYSGMPVSEAEVNIKVEFQPWRWGLHVNKASYQTDIMTDNNGGFILDLPLEGLKGTIFEKGRYSITAQVTSSNGETQQSLPLYFYLGNENQIRPNIADKIKVESPNVKFYVPVYNVEGLPQNVTTEYIITNIDNPLDNIKGSFVSPNLYIPSDELPSGRYSLLFKTGNEETVTTETVIWRPSDNKVPYSTPLWIPETQYSYKPEDQYLEVTFGGYPDEWFLYILSNGEKTITQEWIKPKDGLIKKQINIPSGDSTLFVSLSGMHDLNGETGKIKIVPQKRMERMEVSAVSFRDKITAGDKEDWTFKFKIEEKNCIGVNVFAVMTDQALNAIRDFKWSLNILQPEIYNKVNLRTGRVVNGITYKIFSKVPKYVGFSRLMPDWETYGYPLVSYGMRISGPIMYKTMALRNAKTDMATVETAGTEEANDEVALETPMSSQGAGSIDSKDIELRPVEMPLAFFKTDLKTNDEGEVSLNFEVPNFNTTWQLQLVGYNENLLNASIVMDAVASKPVMVKSNLPQYLRTGDKATVSATLYNNSDKEISLAGKFDIINMITGEIITSQNYQAMEIQPSANRTISIIFNTPVDLNGVIVRAYALSGNYSDGEQGFIPILPSNAPVIESTTFYGKSSQEVIEIKVPKLSKNSNVTLKYCDNPLWEVLLALPGLQDNHNESSLSIAKWLYGTLIASDIIGRNFEIASVLQQILESEDSTLSTGNLHKDPALKITTIEATPWINSATNETARIKSLTQYFDNSVVESRIQVKWDALKQLQQGDGGWSWFDGFRSSPYITSEIIGILGYMNKMGLLNEQGQKMALRGVKYYDSWLEEIKIKNKEISVITTMDYLYSRQMLNIGMDKSMINITKECLDSISSQWRHWDVGRKAKAALVLLNYEEYKDETLTIVASLKEFMGKRIPVESEVILLELFERIEPGSEYVEKVREDLFLQKETEDWGAEIMTVSLINALVSTSPKEVYSREIPIISVNGGFISLPVTQSLTGNFTVNLDPLKVSGKTIKIERSSGVPAWGGIISQYICPVKDVKKVRLDDLAIDKHVYIKDDKGKLKETGSFKQGDKVSVVLNITCTKDMDYVVITDSRAACLQPDNKTSGIIFVDGLSLYREIRKEKTSFFIEHLPAGKYVISYECHADRNGEYSLGIAEVQSLYSPAQIAHSAGRILKIGNQKF